MKPHLAVIGWTVLLALLPSTLSAQTKKAGTKTAKDTWQVDSTKPPKRAPAATSCAQYGAGFVRLPGSDSCIRMGGGLEVGVGVNSSAGR